MRYMTIQWRHFMIGVVLQDGQGAVRLLSTADDSQAPYE